MPGQPFDRIAVLYNYLFHNTSKGHTVAVADILTNYRNHGYESLKSSHSTATRTF